VTGVTGVTHPILRPGPFALWRPEAERLHRELYSTITDPLLIRKLYHGCAEDLLPLNVGQAPDRIWLEALEALSVAGLLPKLAELLGRQPRMPTVAAAVAEVIAAQPLMRQNVISAGVLVLDRQKLRDGLDLLAVDDRSEKVVVVRGQPKSGKTRGRYLFELAAKDHGATPVYLCMGIVVTLDNVLRKLFGQYQARNRIPPKDNSTPDAWYREISYELHDLAVEQRRKLWIAVDDLGVGPDGGPLLDLEIRGFFEQFALQLLDPAVHHWFRLMLINYPDGRVPTEWPLELWIDERTAESDITEADVVALVRRWAAGRDRARMTDEHLAGIAAQVIAAGARPPDPGQPPRPRLQLIHDELVATLGALARAGSS
jgi:hypothetical protein